MKTKLKTLIKRHKEWLIYNLFTPIRGIFQFILKITHLVILTRVTGGGFGDSLVVTTILSAHHKKYATRGIVFSKNPELFINNPLVIRHLDYEKMPKLARSLLKSFCKYMSGRNVICVGLEPWTPGTLPWQRQPADENNPFFYDHMQPDIRYRLDTRGFAPCLTFGEQELHRYEERFAFLPKAFAIVKTTMGGKKPGHQWVTIKNWTIEGMQAVIRQQSSLPWVQIGDIEEELLDGVIDLRGKTDLREMFYVLSQAKIVLTTEGLISHAAAAFDIPTVVVFSGFNVAEGLLYKNTIPVTAHPLPPCAPCWQRECTVPGKPCTSNISIEQVANAVAQALEMYSNAETDADANWKNHPCTTPHAA